jgi:hypothetical protein
VKKLKIGTDEVYYDLKIQHEMEMFQTEKQLFAKKLEYMKKSLFISLFGHLKRPLENPFG